MVKKIGALDISLIATFAILTGVGSYIQIPIFPVPLTFQTFFTYLSGALLGGRIGALSQLIYVLLGAIGFPVYAGGTSGVAHLFGPTGGFLVGFIFGAYVIGVILEHIETPRFLDFLLAIIFGTLVIYAIGLSILHYFVGGSFKVLIPIIFSFLPGDTLKIVLSSYVAYRTRSTVQHLLPKRV